MLCHRLACFSVCPKNFTFNATANGCYRFVNEVNEWETAALLCKQFHKNAHLAFVNSMDEENAIRNVITGNACFAITIYYWLTLIVEISNV